MALKHQNFPPPPDAVANGTKLVSRIAKGAPTRVGTVSDENGKIRWHYAPHRTCESWSSGNPLRKPDFVLFEDGRIEALRIRRISLFPSLFNVLERGKIIGTVLLSSILRNKYTIKIQGMNSWTFHMPLFTVYFFGKSSAGAEFWVAIAPSKMQWNILLKPGLPQLPLAAILAFIHNERYFYS